MEKKNDKKLEPYFAFTDECGSYAQDRSENSKVTHPYYVRATVIISLADYLILQQEMDEAKSELGLTSDVEIKWAHYGSALKGNYKRVPHRLTTGQLVSYYSRMLKVLIKLPSVCVYYTLTDNNMIGKIGETNLYQMHLQNAYQRVQATMVEKTGFAIVVADDLNDKTKKLKEAVYSLTLKGDFVQYTNVKKGLYIDFSNQCPGLQIADICAGVFTAALKYENAAEREKHKYAVEHSLFFKDACLCTRHSFLHAPHFEVYRSGVKEVPGKCGDKKAKVISAKIQHKLREDLEETIHMMIDEQ